MARAIDSRDEDGPERTCLVTRVKGAPEDMIRFVLAPDGQVVADVARRLPGRGAWVSANTATLTKAMKIKAFSRAFKGKGEVSPGLVAEVDALLTADALQWLSLANKAGLVVKGFSKVQAALERGGVAALFQAVEAGPDGARKLANLARRMTSADGEDIATVVIFNGAQLDLALGRANVIHAALMSGPTARTLLARCRRLALFRGLADPAASTESANYQDETSVVDVNATEPASEQLTSGQGPGIANE